MVTDLSVTGARTARDDVRRRGWVAHHNTDLWRATAPIDGPQWGMWPTGGAWLTLPLWDHYEYTGDRRYLQRIYPLLKGAAQFFLDTLVEDPTHGWLVTSPSLSPENAHPFGTSLAIGPDDGRPDPARAVRQRASRRRASSASTPTSSSSGARPARGWRRCRSAAPASCRNGWRTGTCRRPRSTIATCRICTASIPGTTSTSAARRSSPPPSNARWRSAATGHRLGDGLADQPLGAARRRRPRLRHPEVPARPRAHLPQHVRRASAVPDRRQLRRHRGDRRDAAAERRRRDPPAAGAARRVAGRPSHRPAERAADSRST